MPLYVKDAGSWKEVTNAYVKDTGSWKEITDGYVKDAGSWKSFLEPAGPAYHYVIGVTGNSGGASIAASFSVTPTGDGANPAWTMNYVSSSPAGFWSGNTSSTTGWTPTITSTSKTASPGTLVQLTYRVNFSSNAGDAEETYVTYSHQF